MLRNKFRFMPMLEGEGGGGTGGTGGAGGSIGGDAAGGTGGSTLQIDYEKIASLISGKQTVTEDTVLKNYFKQQGISQEDMGEAIKLYKEHKEKNTPNVEVLQQQTQQAQAAALSAQMEKEAYFMAAEIGVEVKTIPYLMKLADTKEVIEEGKVNKEKLKEALNQVLKDVPQLKKQDDGGTGFKFGAGGGGNTTHADEEALKSAFGL